jgi:fibronectin-binding autotransporter adhesin
MTSTLSARFQALSVLSLASLFAGLVLFSTPALAQTTSTWRGGAGNWSPCPNQSGTALWDTCSANPPAFPDGNYNAVIMGGPVNATGASVVNLSIGTGDVLNIAGTTYVDITGPSVVNNGSIILTSGNGFQFEGNITSTLSGSGSVQMNNSAVRFWGGNGTPTLNLQQPITGQGSILGLVLNNQSTITASGGTLNIQPAAGGLTNTGTIKAQSGSTINLIGAAPFNNTGGTINALNGSTIWLEANITGGTITSSGTGNYTLAPPGAGAGLLNLTNAGTFNVPSGAGLNWTGTITNTGLFNLLGQIFTNGTVTLKGSGTVLMNSGNFNGLNANSLVNQQLIHGTGSFFGITLTNQATINADNSSGMLSINGSPTTNTSTLEASGGGTLELASVTNNTGGKIEALNGSTVILANGFSGSGGTLSTSGTGTIQSQNGQLDGTLNIPTNTGILELNGFDLFTKGTIANNGTMSITSGCMIMNQPTTLTGTGTLTMSSTGCIFGAGLSFTNKSTIEGAGTIGDSNPMPITNAGMIIANQPGGTLFITPNTTGFTNTGTLIVNPGSTLDITGNLNNLNKGVLNGGTYAVGGVLDLQNSIVTLAAPLILTGSGAQIFDAFHGVNALASLTSNTGKGVLSVQTGQSLATAGNFANKAKLIVGAGSTFTAAGGAFTQSSGSTTVDGTLAAHIGLTLTKGTIQGKGTIAAPVTSNAVFVAGDSPTTPGTLTISGSYTQSATGTLDIPVNGATAGTQYGRLVVSNGVSLSGILTIKRKAAFVPAIGTNFTILKGSVVSGQFTTVNGATINAAEHFAVNYSSGAVTLTVASGP